MACYSLTQFVSFQRGSCSFDNIVWNIQVHGLLQSNSVLSCFREGPAALTTSFGIFKYMACYSLTQFVSFQRGSCSFDDIIWNIQIHGLLQSNSVCLISERVEQLWWHHLEYSNTWPVTVLLKLACFREGRAALTTSFGIFKYMACHSLTQCVLFQRGLGSFNNIIWNIQVHGLFLSKSVCLVSERVGKIWQHHLEYSNTWPVTVLISLSCFREGREALTTSFGIFKYMACYCLTQFVLFQRGSGSFNNIIWNIQIHGLLLSYSVCLVSERVVQLWQHHLEYSSTWPVTV